MSKVERFEDLICWQKSRILVAEIYRLTEHGKFSKDFGLRDQIRRASLSIMNNIAEGFNRFSRKEFIRFLEMSAASAMEVKSILYVALDIEYFELPLIGELQSKCEEIKKLNLSLIRYLNSQIKGI